MPWNSQIAAWGKRFAWSKVAVFGGYVLLSLLIGEVHPFTQVTMYNSFPNWAYVFYLQNERGETIHLRKGMHMPVNADGMAHIFYSYNNRHGIKYGYGEEDEKQLLEAGQYMAETMRGFWPASVPHPKEIWVLRRHLYRRDGRIHEDDKMIGHAVFTENH